MDFTVSLPDGRAAAPGKLERIHVRVSSPVKHLLQQAARAAHKSVSEFLLEAGIAAANQALAERSRFEPRFGS